MDRPKTVSKGFTLMEVLVALSILSIGMLAVYKVNGEALHIASYGKSREALMDKGYERLLLHVHYPNIHQGQSEDYEGQEIEYIYKREETIIPMVNKVDFQTKSGDTTIYYEYFETMK